VQERSQLLFWGRAVEKMEQVGRREKLWEGIPTCRIIMGLEEIRKIPVGGNGII